MGPVLNSHHAEGVGVDGAQPAPVTEVAGGMVGRADLSHATTEDVVRLADESPHEAMHRFGVLNGAGQGAAARSWDAPPRGRNLTGGRLNAPSFDGRRH